MKTIYKIIMIAGGLALSVLSPNLFLICLLVGGVIYSKHKLNNYNEKKENSSE